MKPISKIPIIECVPNFSEGRDPDKIQAIAESISHISGVKVLDLFAGESTNRTVITFCGPPQPVLDAALAAMRQAAQVIDMRCHTGTHIRIGSTDVCPLVPLNQISRAECIDLSHRLAQKTAASLDIPVYLYAYSATRPSRRNLAQIRAGQYEKLENKLKNEKWKPDYGEARFNPACGASVIGVRDILIAYNINLNTKDEDEAHKIACRLRESGQKPSNESKRIPGLFKGVLAMGWYVPEYRKSQISMNVLNYRRTPLHQIYETARKEASKAGLKVTGSEIIGLVPEKALLDAGLYYMKQSGKRKSYLKPDIIQAAAAGLGLSEIHPFHPETRILDYHFPMQLDQLRQEYI